MGAALLLALLLFGNVLGATQKPCIVCRLHGPLGHQMFQVATAVALAKDHNATALFPDLQQTNQDNTATHYKTFFRHLNASNPDKQDLKKYTEINFIYTPIPYTPNMLINGFFQCEKHFAHRKHLIQELFTPDSQLVIDLQSHYGYIIADPKSVSIHIQKNMHGYDSTYVIYAKHGRKYVQKAIELFPDDYNFYVFSDDINWCISELADLSPHMRFIETPTIYHELYLQSLCQHNIISNSSLSWWSAWLNKNPNKIVIAPKQWFHPTSPSDSRDIIPQSWYQLSY